MPLQELPQSTPKKRRRQAASANIRELHAAHHGEPDWPMRRIIAAALNEAGLSNKKRPKKKKR